MYKLRCQTCEHEWVNEFKQDCPECAVERMVRSIQQAREERTEQFRRKQDYMRRVVGMPVSDREQVCEGCDLPLNGNSYYEDEGGERNRICDSCGHAHRQPQAPMMYMMNEKDWRSKY